jgi:predicted Zn-ribbon and HTH transcriptional regulator
MASKKKKATKNLPKHFHVSCNACKIKLVELSKMSRPSKCSLCKSSDIVTKLWGVELEVEIGSV